MEWMTDSERSPGVEVQWSRDLAEYQFGMPNRRLCHVNVEVHAFSSSLPLIRLLMQVWTAAGLWHATVIYFSGDVCDCCCRLLRGWPGRWELRHVAPPRPDTRARVCSEEVPAGKYHSLFQLLYILINVSCHAKTAETVTIASLRKCYMNASTRP